MIVLDANLLIYAYDSKSVAHERARAWVELALSGGERVGIPWQSIYAFLRVVSNPRLQVRFSLEKAMQIVDNLILHSNVTLITPGTLHLSILKSTAIDGQAQGPLLSDAVLAALTIEWGGTLCTTDRDFARFSGLRWTNPLDTATRISKNRDDLS